MTNLLWLDFETDGLDDDPRLLEVAVVAARGIAPGAHYHAFIDDLGDFESVTQMYVNADPIVQEMHDSSGLWDDLIDARAEGRAKGVDEVENDLLALVRSRFGDATTLLAGAGVSHFDHDIVKDRMPRLAKRLHYSTVDVSVAARTLEAVAGIRVPDPEWADGRIEHRAGDDVDQARRRAAIISDRAVLKRPAQSSDEG